MFYVTNTKAVASLTNTVIESPSNKNLIEVTSDRWGTEGSNGGDFEFTAAKQSLKGDVVANNISTVSVSLTNGSNWTRCHESQTHGQGCRTVPRCFVGLECDRGLLCLGFDR